MRRLPLRLLSVLASTGLVACAGPSASPSASSPQPSTSASATPSDSPPVSATPSAAENEAPSPTPITGDPPPVALEVVADGLAAPIGIEGAPGGWLIVNEQGGRMVAVHPDRGERETVVDLTDRIASGGERGLLGLALHPDWPEVPRAFVHYSDLDGNTVLAELAGSQDGDGAPVLDAGSERVLLQVTQPYVNHNGGQLAFGPDGYLWFGLGDGGSGNDPHGHGQDATTLLGSILRLDVSQPGAYAVPPDNPFADGTGGAPEVYLIGLRNPWRFSFDPATGLLWVADVGQGTWEEVTRLDPSSSAGANLGWNLMEGAHCFAVVPCSPDGLVLPLTEYHHGLGCSITGGYVYRGSAIPGLAGWYLFSDYCSGALFAIASDAPNPTDTPPTPQVLATTGLSISAFGVDDAGELYVADLSGAISRIVDGG